MSKGMLRIPRFDPERDRPLLAHATLAHRAFFGDFEAACRDELGSWEGTPHRAGQQRKRAGVDCTHFVAAVLDWAYESAGCASSLREIGPLPRSAQDLGVHRDCLAQRDDDPGTMAGAAWWFARRYVLRTGFEGLLCLQPLDLVVMEVAGGANHLGIVGAARPTARGAVNGDLWHASGGAGGVVCRASLADAALRRRVRTVFRPCVGGES